MASKPKNQLVQRLHNSKGVLSQDPRLLHFLVQFCSQPHRLELLLDDVLTTLYQPKSTVSEPDLTAQCPC